MKTCEWDRVGVNLRKPQISLTSSTSGNWDTSNVRPFLSVCCSLLVFFYTIQSSTTHEFFYLVLFFLVLTLLCPSSHPVNVKISSHRVTLLLDFNEYVWIRISPNVRLFCRSCLRSSVLEQIIQNFKSCSDHTDVTSKGSPFTILCYSLSFTFPPVFLVRN